jgi:hypothetical protein
VLALRNVEQLNILENVASRFLARAIFPPSDFLALKELKEAQLDRGWRIGFCELYVS